jgi:hypothetical protein
VLALVALARQCPDRGSGSAAASVGYVCRDHRSSGRSEPAFQWCASKISVTDHVRRVRGCSCMRGAVCAGLRKVQPEFADRESGVRPPVLVTANCGIADSVTDGVPACASSRTSAISLLPSVRFGSAGARRPLGANTGGTDVLRRSLRRRLRVCVPRPSQEMGR